ncbi:MAG: hypothetical protein C4541_10250 [Candidatus Auribacter fodinae]|jgi:uncharacterized protein|uniref:TPM domain-containing protein n=1 Tax=Candidatus Auribacter fodinae TaxID=2093366 RepID=A0A3A4QX50_9BACT|nr:MAG: hypothetical protein C4541_10250 [Candidatus Auribacter fodinae]
MRKIIILLFLFIDAFIFSPCLQAQELPRYKSVVNDYAEVLTHNHKLKITKYAQAIYYKTGIEFAVLAVAALDDLTIEQFAEQVYKEWHLGQKDKDNGVLLVIVVADETMWIEAGYGLEDILTEGMRKAILGTTVPFMKNEWYGQAIYRAALHIIDQLSREYAVKISDFPEIEPLTEAGEEDTYKKYLNDGIIILILIIVALFLQKIIRSALPKKQAQYGGFWSDGYRGGFNSSGLHGGFGGLGGLSGRSTGIKRRW